MEKIFAKYFDYVLTSIIHDVEYFNNWWMIFIVPAILWFCVLIFKYFVLLFPVWFPLAIISRMFKSEKTIIVNNKENGTDHNNI